MSCCHWSNTDDDSRSTQSHHSQRCKGGHWSGMNIAAMVIGFIIFPPLGLVVLVWTLAGHPIQSLPAAIRNKWNEFSSGEKKVKHADSGNVVFKEYQQTQYDRINELKEEIRTRAERFRAFRSDTKRREDQKEFDSFMASAPVNDDDK